LQNDKNSSADIRHKKFALSNKFLFIAKNPDHLIVVEVKRKESGKTEINTIYKIDKKEQRRLDKFPTA